MTAEEKIRDDLASELFDNAMDFLNNGLSYLLSHPPSNRVSKLTVVNLQMSLELLIKWYLIKNVNLQAIFTPTLSAIRDLRQEIWQGRVFSKNYGVLKRQFLSCNYLDAPQVELLNKFQNYRNRIVHSFLTLSYDEGVFLSAELAFKVMRRIVDHDPDIPFTDFIDKELYQKLIGYPLYVEHSEDLAEQVVPDEVLICWECQNRTLGEIGDDYYCFCCGSKTPTQALGYAECPFCKEKAFAYDKLNLKECGTVGRCIKCDKDAAVEACVNCDAPVFIEYAGRKGKMGWYCDFCESLAEEE